MCKHFDVNTESTGEGLCRRTVPQALVIVTPQRNFRTGNIEPQQQVVSAWPPTPADGWCGEFASKLAIGH
jgi:hypothetical protein